MPIGTIVSVVLALVAKAPEIYEDAKFLIETLASGKEPTPEQLQKIKDIIAKNEIAIDKA